MEKIDNTGQVSGYNNSDIDLDTSVLQDQNETFSSLTDTYGIALFTDQYEKKVQETGRTEYSTYQNLNKAIFTKDLKTKTDEYQEVQEQLFLDTGMEVRKEEAGQTDNTMGISIAITGIIVILFLFAFFIIFDTGKQRRRKDAVI